MSAEHFERRSGPHLPAALDAAARTVVRRFLAGLQGGRVIVVENGTRSCLGVAGELEATLRVFEPSMWRRSLFRNGVGLAEAYIDGVWDSDDLVTLLRILARDLHRLDAIRKPLIRLWALAGGAGRGRPTEAEDRRNIHAHYDLGNDFFRLFLDPTMAYSCALFEHPGMSLEEAQLAKYDAIASRLGLGPSSDVVEIGTGWGGFAVHAARAYGCRVTTTTISDRQYEHARDLVRRNRLEDRVTVLRSHYRELRGEFTHLVSIEMIEAVDWRLHGEFFRTVARLLRPDGLAAIQAIVVPDQEFHRSKRLQDFVKQHIFPGGCLPAVAEMVDTTRRVTDLSLVDLRDIGASYAVTLRHWREALERQAGAVRALGFDERFLRNWRYYFAYCEAGFAERRVSDVQLVFARPEWRGRLRDAWPESSGAVRSRAEIAAEAKTATH